MSGTQIVEVNGVKVEVDMRHARRIDELRIGSKVKVCKKRSFGGEYDVCVGIVVGFEPFSDLPTIIVAYIKQDYGSADLAFVHFNKNTKDVQIVAAIDNDLSLDREMIEDWFKRQIEKKIIEIEELEAKREYFRRNFSAYWAHLSPEGDSRSALADERTTTAEQAKT